MTLSAASINEKFWWGILILLLIGYLVGSWLNRRRSKALGLWLQAGLRTLGGQTAWKWIGTMSAGAQVTVEGAEKPFHQALITYLLLTRELLPLWGIELLRGKRDLLTFNANLRSTPVLELEIVPLNGGLRRKLDAHAGEEPWRWQEIAGGLGLAVRKQLPSSALRAVEGFADHYGRHLERLSLRTRQPHLVLFIRLEGLEKTPAADLIHALQKLANAAVRSEQGLGGAAQRA